MSDLRAVLGKGQGILISNPLWEEVGFSIIFKSQEEMGSCLLLCCQCSSCFLMCCAHSQQRTPALFQSLMWLLHMHCLAPRRASKLSQTQLTSWADGKEERIGKRIPLSICLRSLAFNLYYI